MHVLADLVTSIVQGVLGLAFAVGAVASFVFSVGTAAGLASALGLAAVGSLAACISSAVAAGKLAGYVRISDRHQACNIADHLKE